MCYPALVNRSWSALAKQDTHIRTHLTNVCQPLAERRQLRAVHRSTVHVKLVHLVGGAVGGGKQWGADRDSPPESVLACVIACTCVRVWVCAKLTMSLSLTLKRSAGNSMISKRWSGGFTSSHVASKSTTTRKSKRCGF